MQNSGLDFRTRYLHSHDNNDQYSYYLYLEVISESMDFATDIFHRIADFVTTTVDAITVLNCPYYETDNDEFVHGDQFSGSKIYYDSKQEFMNHLKRTINEAVRTIKHDLKHSS